MPITTAIIMINPVKNLAKRPDNVITLNYGIEAEKSMAPHGNQFSKIK
jgi:hypothetical protein